MKKYRLKKWYPSLDNDFEVGDIVFYDKERGCYAKPNNRDTVLRKREVENNPDFWELIEEENPKPLFITEDGVEVFEGDSYYTVTKPYFAKTELKAKEMPYENSDFKYFFHEPNADEYIRLNKKDYSLNDIERNIESLAKNLGYRLIKVQNDSQWTPAPEDCTCWKIKEKSESSSKCEAEKIDGRCPKCGGELEYSHIDRVLLSNPPKRQINCTECAHVGYLTIERIKQ